MHGLHAHPRGDPFFFVVVVVVFVAGGGGSVVLVPVVAVLLPSLPYSLSSPSCILRSTCFCFLFFLFSYFKSIYFEVYTYITAARFTDTARRGVLVWSTYG